MRSRASGGRLVVVGGSALALSACGGMLDPAGEGAAKVENLWWLMFWLGLIPFLIVLGLVLAVARRSEPTSVENDRRFVVYGGVVLSSILLVPVIAATAVVQLDLELPGEDRMAIQVTGHQFWWDIQYDTPDGTLRTANELHIPVDVPIDLALSSADVIHSFWVPEIAGKMDLVPGRINELQIMANEPGVFRGRCAEFCGLAHANMQLIVVAHPADEFESWLERESAPATVEADIGTLQEFANSCAPCHTVRGLFDNPSFEGNFGPDLTHFNSRRMLAANIIPNTPEFLARWLVDPDGVKPGTRMPDVGLEPEDLEALLDLLDQLD